MPAISGSNYDDYEDYNYSDYDESEESTEATVGTKPMYTTTVAPTTRSPIKTIKSGKYLFVNNFILSQ